MYIHGTKIKEVYVSFLFDCLRVRVYTSLSTYMYTSVQWLIVGGCGGPLGDVVALW